MYISIFVRKFGIPCVYARSNTHTHTTTTTAVLGNNVELNIYYVYNVTMLRDDIFGQHSSWYVTNNNILCRVIRNAIYLRTYLELLYSVIDGALKWCTLEVFRRFDYQLRFYYISSMERAKIPISPAHVYAIKCVYWTRGITGLTRIRLYMHGRRSSWDHHDIKISF